MSLEKKIIWLLKAVGLFYLMINIPMLLFFNYQRIVKNEILDLGVNFGILVFYLLVIFKIEKIFKILRLSDLLETAEKNKLIINTPKNLFKITMITISLVIGFFQIKILIGLITSKNIESFLNYKDYYCSSIGTLLIMLFLIIYNVKITNLLFKNEDYNN